MGEDKPQFNVGDLVYIEKTRLAGKFDVPEGEARIIKFEPGGILYTVKPTISSPNEFYHNVPVTSMRPTIMLPPSRKRSDSDVKQPGLLSPDHLKVPEAFLAPRAIPKKDSASSHSSRTRQNLESVLKANKARRTNKEQPLVDHLSKNRNKKKGWLRLREAQLQGVSSSSIYSDDGNFKPLTENEKNRYSLCSSSLPPTRDCKKDVKPKELLNFAWGIGTATGVRICNKATTPNGVKKQKRKDAGTNIFNSDAKRKQYLSPFQYFSKLKHLQRKDPNEKIDAKTLKDVWERMTEEQKRPSVMGSERWMLRAPYLIGEIST
eukprot:CAMPEP_0196803174 /NCGR_PEP_ID=MMETSP1362-20130617/2568_1 /TAXON_ID=163516 /ORGANISM="Leptocylindrus danicus, Strain CCMP1856" /LENGTH=319 /DNA_ID=CAMNT_0042174619 /DNA_START=192 /DNA_END=1147 /DNA_ORIENTATION=+